MEEGNETTEIKLHVLHTISTEWFCSAAETGTNETFLAINLKSVRGNDTNVFQFLFSPTSPHCCPNIRKLIRKTRTFSALPFPFSHFFFFHFLLRVDGPFTIVRLRFTKYYHFPIIGGGVGARNSKPHKDGTFSLLMGYNFKLTVPRMARRTRGSERERERWNKLCSSSHLLNGLKNFSVCLRLDLHSHT